MSATRTVVWHDVECGSYREDVALWRALAEEAARARSGDAGRATGDGPAPQPRGATVLDVGAGTGRIALDLAAGGHDVVALDADGDLLATLRERAAERGLHVVTATADARDFALDRTFDLIAVPMQTLQLLGGADGRAAFLCCARAHLSPGGLVAAALADALESFDADTDGLPEPDVAEVDGQRYVSLPLAVVDEGSRAAIHRLRQVVAPDGTRDDEHDVIRLDRVAPEQLAAEAQELGYTPLPARRIPATDEYVGSTVVVLRG